MIMISVMDIPKGEQHTHARALLRECLKKANIDFSEDCLAFGEHGKPYLRDFPDVHFSLTHSNGIAACMVSDCECGIDAEAVRKFPEKVIRRVCSEKEKQTLESLPESERDMYFFRLWTLKEAYVKMLGRGISYPMSTAEFSINDGISTNIEDCTFSQYILKGGRFVVSVCRRTVDR